MNWAWTASLDQFWRSPTFPMWLTLAAAGFFAIIVLVTLMRAEKSVANGALTVITLLAIGVASAATLRGFGPHGRDASAETGSPPPMVAAFPALSCIDDLAGETVLTACEKALFGSAENAAAALSYAASQLSRLAASGDVAAANGKLTPELAMLRRAIERDRYGLMAYVLMARDHCTPSDCAAFRALTDRQQIVANMDERTYDGLISRYAPTWNAPPARGGSAGGGARAIHADGQADQCRFSLGSLDPARQHHDARAEHFPGARGAAGARACSRRKCPAAVTAPGVNGSRADRSQEACRAAICARGARSARARGTAPAPAAQQRMMLSKRAAGR